MLVGRVLFAVVVVVLAFQLFAPPAAAKDCISDSELEATVGDQVRAGTFAIDASALGDRAMCSHLPVARAIQQLVERHSTSGRQPAATALPGQSPASAANLTQTSAATPDIGGDLAFEDPRECYSEAMVALFDKVIDKKPVSIGSLGPVRFTRAGPDSDGWLTDIANINARWNGLTITQIEFQHIPDTDGSSKNLLFEESASTVQAALNQLGFNIKQLEKQQEVGSEMSVYIHLGRRGAGAKLMCGT